MRIPASALVALALLAGPFAIAQAQDLPAGVQLGMTAPQLRGAVPALRRVPNPAHLAGGLVGAWTAPALELAGVAVTPTFFFAEGQLRRVEYLAAQPGPQAFDALVQWGRMAWGQELASEGPEGAYATWSQGAADAYLQRTGGARRPQVRLVVRQRVVKDAGEL